MEQPENQKAGVLMEEKILLPAAQRWRGGEPLPIAAKLRLDHGALASLLMPTPTAAILATLLAVPEVTVMPYNDSPPVMNAVRRVLERAGYQLRERHPE